MVLVLLLSLLVIPAAAQEPPSDSPAPSLRIAVSTPVLADIVARTAGPRAEVWSIVPTTGDPHSYEATPRDLVAVAGADLYVEMGANLERYAEAGAWRRTVQDSRVPVLRLADHLDLIVKDVVIDHGDHVHDLRAGDPHVWFDPTQVRRIVEVVRDELTRLDPAGAADWSASAAVWDAELAALDAELTAGFAAIPAEHRRLVVLHDAFAYLAARYDFEVLGFVTPAPGQEPSASDIAALIELVETAGVPAVFTEPQIEDGILRMVAAETGVEVGTLLTDSFLGEVDTYLELMRYDLAELTRLLG
jgi:ABC-type Zn uptake system ZnuABC Zn-binding protein ZnuA